MTKQPFMPLFFGDFLASTAEWSGEERALYLLLLSYQWSMGSLPNDTKRLAKLVDYERRLFEQHWPVICKKFVERDDRLYNLRLETHRERSIELGNKRSNAGKTGAAKRWQTDGNATAIANGKPGGNRIASATNLLCHPSHPIPSQSKNSLENSPPDSCVVPPPRARALHANDGDDVHEVTTTLQALYPQGTYRQSNWILAERAISKLLDGEATSDQLERLTTDFAAQQRAKGSEGTQFVMSPEKFYGPDGHWRGPFPLPAAQATTIKPGRKSFAERHAALVALSGDDDQPEQVPA